MDEEADHTEAGSTLKSYHYKRGNCSTQVTRMAGKIKVMKELSPEQWHTYELSDHQQSIMHQKQLREKIEENIQLHHTLTNKEEEDDERLRDKFEDASKALLYDLARMRTIAQAHRKFKNLLEDITTLVAASGAGRSLRQIENCEARFAELRESGALEMDIGDHIKTLSDSVKTGMRELASMIRTEDVASARHRERDAATDDGSSGRRWDCRSSTRLPRISIPTFRGDHLEWPSFWDVFNRTVVKNKELAEDEKMSYLSQAIQDPSYPQAVDSGSSTAGRFEMTVKQLQARYDRKRMRHSKFTADLFTCPKCPSTSGPDLHKLHTRLSRAVRNLEATGQYTAGQLAAAHAETLLPDALARDWHLKEDDRHVVPDIGKLLAFVEIHANLPQHCQPEAIHSKPSRPQPERRNEDRGKRDDEMKYEEPPSPRQNYATQTGKSCSLCKEAAHPYYLCEVFKGLTVAERGEVVRERRLCFNCLTQGHTTRDCTSANRCRTCKKLHHTMLHREYRQMADPVEKEETHVVASATVVSGKLNVPGIFIPTMQVTVHSPDNREVQIRAMMDSGSTISLIKASVAKKLGLKLHTRNAIKMIGARGTALGTAKSQVRFTLQSRQAPEAKLDMTAYVVDEVAADLPEKKVKNEWKFLDSVNLADPTFNTPGRVELLLGNDVLDDIVQEGTLRGQEDFPRASKTLFGWVVEGRMAERELPEENEEKTVFCATIAKLSVAEELLARHQETHILLKSFWEMEEVQKEKPTWTPEERQAMAHFTDTHLITKEGRFQVTLPRKADAGRLGNSRGRALKRFETNERALMRRGQWKKFQEVVGEYLVLDHAQEVPVCKLSLPPQDCYYMPMHAVLKETSTTTKLRVVFDASAATSTGLSYNDTLMTGPTIQSSLTEILIRFRTHRVAVSADISKMYRAIELTPLDRDFHRFLWRREDKGEIKDYMMKRVTFGVTASPFVATRVLQEVAHLAAAKEPKASQSILQCFYVDDYLTGAESHEEASILCHQVMKLLEAHGLVLRKWRSSSPGFLGTIPTTLRETEESPEVYGPTSYQKTLGIHWDASSDRFFVSTSALTLPKTLTKRLLSSDIHRTFDVLGWLTPVTLTMKILLQHLWELKTEWDEVVPTSVQKEWEVWRQQLPELAAVPITRYYFRKKSSPCSLHLHGFADASTKAYAAVIYVRALYPELQPTVTLVTAKSRVAPLKPLSVPKLELCAAQLLGELMRMVMSTLSVSISDVTCWTDSTIVLNWLDGSARRYKTYVANRIVRTLDLIPSDSWKHVPTISNPADCASRGLLPMDLITHPLWWTGPEWLSTDPVTIPPQPVNQLEGLEQKTVTSIRTSTPLTWLVDRWSSYKRLRRMTAWIRRFIRQARPGTRRQVEGTLSVQELDEADRVLLRDAQERTFGHGRNQGAARKELQGLHPFVDKEGVIRVGGRLANSELSHDQQHPVILHGKDQLSKLLILQCHEDTGHAGPSLILTKLGSRYHMVRAIRQIKAICSGCVTCRKIRAKPAEQLMGQLPADRVRPGRTFETIGLDYAGPILTRYAHIRKPVFVKTYVCVFICMATRAIHLEAVSDTTTEAFLACLQRFVARRGRPSTIYSDNGTNFVGAARQLEEALMLTPASKEAIATHCANKGITWKFSPERAPHFGGIWEAGVKSMKHHLRRIMGDHKLTFEELTTVLARIESMLNGRPLGRVHAHSQEGVEVLTPGHFLIGRPLEALPDRSPRNTGSLTRRWNLCQQLTQHFWTRWSEEYLLQLQRMNKWTSERTNFKIGDVVLMKEDGLVKPDWPLARVMQTFPGKDGLVRVVMVKAKNSNYKRPVAKLVMILPSEDSRQVKEKDSSLLGGGMKESGKSLQQTATPQEGGAEEGGAEQAVEATQDAAHQETLDGNP